MLAPPHHTTCQCAGPGVYALAPEYGSTLHYTCLCTYHRHREQETAKNKVVAELQEAANRLAATRTGSTPAGSQVFPTSAMHTSSDALHLQPQPGDLPVLNSNRTSHMSMEPHSGTHHGQQHGASGPGPLSSQTATSGNTAPPVETNGIIVYVPTTSHGSGQHAHDKHRLAVASNGVRVGAWCTC